MKQGWRSKKLGDVCEVIAGQSPKGEYYNSDGVGLPFYQGKKEFTGKYIGLPKKWTSVTTKEALKDDVLMSVRAPVGPVNFSTQRICIGRGLAAIRTGSLINKEFLYNFLVNHENQIVGNTGAVFNSINQTQIKSIPIPVPPLEEQKQIVAKLDQCFEAIDKAKANAAKNLENAKELFQSKLNEIFSQKGEGWVEKKLGAACLITMGQSPKGTSYNQEGEGVPLINGPVEFGKDSFDKTIKSKFTTEPTKMCRQGDLILCVRGSTTGKINIAGFDACIGRGVASIRFDQNQRWLDYFIRSKRNEIYSLGTGSTFPNVSRTILSKLPFLIPPVEQQNRLVETMNKLLSSTNLLQVKYQQELNSLEELKKSILQKAFEGEL
jgi:type I restriction enzyme S subunit